jgi:hypothetical protein
LILQFEKGQRSAVAVQTVAEIPPALTGAASSPDELSGILGLFCRAYD